MAKSPKNIPNNYPLPLGYQILKADAYRQASIIRQEILTDLVEIAAHMQDSPDRKKLMQVLERNLKAGTAAAEKAEELWPDPAEAREVIEETGAKPAAMQKNLRLFSEFDSITKKSLQLLHDSHAHIRIIIEKLQPPPTNHIPESKNVSKIT